MYQPNYRYKIIKSDRKSIAIEIRTDYSVLVRVPKRMPQFRIMQFLKEKESWIHANMVALEMREQLRPATEQLSDAEMKKLEKEAREVLPKKVEFFANKMGLTYNRIAIRCQRTRWGSCSSKKNLNLNLLLMLTPEDVQDYVVVHELCHLVEMNHSKKFWELVEEVLPDYKERRKWLNDHGSEIMRRAGK